MLGMSHLIRNPGGTAIPGAAARRPLGAARRGALLGGPGAPAPMEFASAKRYLGEGLLQHLQRTGVLYRYLATLCSDSSARLNAFIELVRKLEPFELTEEEKNDSSTWLGALLKTMIVSVHWAEITAIASRLSLPHRLTHYLVVNNYFRFGDHGVLPAGWRLPQKGYFLNVSFTDIAVFREPRPIRRATRMIIHDALGTPENDLIFGIQIKYDRRRRFVGWQLVPLSDNAQSIISGPDEDADEDDGFWEGNARSRGTAASKGDQGEGTSIGGTQSDAPRGRNVPEKASFAWHWTEGRIKRANHPHPLSSYAVALNAHTVYTIGGDGAVTHDPTMGMYFRMRQPQISYSNNKEFPHYLKAATLLCARGTASLTNYLLALSEGRTSPYPEGITRDADMPYHELMADDPDPLTLHGRDAFQYEELQATGEDYWLFPAGHGISVAHLMAYCRGLVFLRVPLRHEPDWVPIVQGLSGPVPRGAYLFWPQMTVDENGDAVYGNGYQPEPMMIREIRGFNIRRAREAGMQLEYNIPAEKQRAVTIMSKCAVCKVERATHRCDRCGREVCLAPNCH